MDTSLEKRARWTPIFDRLPEDKRMRVLYSAKKAFAESGFTGANVNDIAKDAGISVGALYKYFRSKDDIFLAIIDASRDQLEGMIDQVLKSEKSFLGRVEALLRLAISSSQDDPDIVRIYIACTTQELKSLAVELTSRIESVTANRYPVMIEEARKSGEINPTVDDRAAAFMLDDLLLMLQFSYGSDYYKDRLRLFLGVGAGDPLAEPEAIVSSMLAFLKAAFRAS
jgi:Transcriptional regulator